MKLEEIKRIASLRTKGEWERKHHGVYSNHFHPEESYDLLDLVKLEDLEFIAMASNHIDRLIAVAEAAKDIFAGSKFGEFHRLAKAVEALEKE